MADKAHTKTDEKLEEMESALLCQSFKNFNNYIGENHTGTAHSLQQ